MSSVDSDNNQDCELNLAPIIDCFTVLIAYLMVSASFIGFMVFDVGVSVTGKADDAQATTEVPKFPPLALNLRVSKMGVIETHLTGGEQNLDLSETIQPLPNVKVNFAKLEENLVVMKQKWLGLTDASLSAESQVSYRDIVGVIEAIKPIFPKIFLQGEKVSSAIQESPKNDAK